MISPKSHTGIPFENKEVNSKSAKLAANAETVTPEKEYELEVVWFNVVYLIAQHTGCLIGLYLALTSAKTETNLFAMLLYVLSGIGVTAGAHRLWAHRAYKATWQLKLILAFLNTMTVQGHVLAWARDHRVHHKFSDTMADPYSAARGFFFSHCAWLFYRKHPQVIEKGKGIDMSDLEAEPILRFQKKYYWPLIILACFVIPSVIPVYCWNESWIEAFFVPGVLRLTLVLHGTFIVNSFAHFYGYKPYDRNIQPVDNVIVSFFAVGEGWHNYHHTFPWDWRTSEFGNFMLSPTSAFINFFAWIGWAYDLKIVCPEIVKKRVQRTGDGSHELWGWGDKDITKNDEEATIITYKHN